MFAVGHLALGHICGFIASKLLKTRINIPLILLLSIIADIDLLIPQIEHRGPFHSAVAAILIFIPLLFIYKKTAIPYFAALVQHGLIGDFISGGRIQILWPLNTQHYGAEVGIKNPVSITVEWILFMISLFIILRTDQITTLLSPNHSNMLLTIPTATILLPILTGFPLRVPASLILPHLAYLLIFSISILTYLIRPLRQTS